jgi:hypothetical protein
MKLQPLLSKNTPTKARHEDLARRPGAVVGVPSSGAFPS